MKAVLLHNSNKQLSIPLADAVNMKETMVSILEAIKYKECMWQVCSVLKVVLLIGLQGGFTKYCCFVCLGDSHYQVKNWRLRQNFVAVRKNSWVIILKMEKREYIQVFVRSRPINDTEKQQKSFTVINCINDKEVKIVDGKGKPEKSFVFDKVFGPQCKQIEVYKAVMEHVINEVLSGFNCTVFAYGQTGSGKTYTMEGERTSDKSLTWENDRDCGIIPRCLSHLFDELHQADLNFTVRVSFLELYNEVLIDLLSSPDDSTKLKLYDDKEKKGSVIVSGLEEVVVQNKDEVYKILEKGSAKRRMATTLLNAQSSRSHTIFSISLHMREMVDDEEIFKTGKLYLVDLAGSENIGRSGSVDKHAREAGSINQSLLTLGRVITALVDRKHHIPYRESKLTRLLQDSLGGRTKTTIIATVSPASVNYEETLSTLNYASRAKKIVNKPQMNKKQTQRALIKEYSDELERLRKLIKVCRNKEGICIPEESYNGMVEQIKVIERKLMEKIGQIQAIEEEKDRLEDIIQELRDNSAKIEMQCKEEKFIVEQHIITEQSLMKQASELKKVADQAASHTQLLHDKLDRVKSIELNNKTAASTFYNKFSENLQIVRNLWETHFMNETFYYLNSMKYISELDTHQISVINNVKLSADVTCSKCEEIKTNLIKLEETVKNTSSFKDLIQSIASEISESKTNVIQHIESVPSRVNNVLEDICQLKENNYHSASLVTTNMINLKEKVEKNEKCLSNMKADMEYVSDDITEISNKIHEILELNKKIFNQYTAEKLAMKSCIEEDKELYDKISQHLSVTTNSVKQHTKGRIQNLRQISHHITLLKETASHITSRRNILNANNNKLKLIKLAVESNLQDVNNKLTEIKSCLSQATNHRTEFVIKFQRDISSDLDVAYSEAKESGVAVINIFENISNYIKRKIVNNIREFKSNAVTVKISVEKSKLELDDRISSSISNLNEFKDQLQRYQHTGGIPNREDFIIPSFLSEEGLQAPCDLESEVKQKSPSNNNDDNANGESSTTQKVVHNAKLKAPV
ncbi:kinesin-like protein KIF11 [Lycorma delicatula]|uniref:kinesin-like protein KIF11 n=1 Tax=Lycorma delicatula TaxID=130591 RepID=UPI003F5102B3